MTPRLRDHWLRMDLRSVGLFRVAIGCVLLCHLSNRWSLRDDLFSPSGVLPDSLLSASLEIPNFPTLLTALDGHSWGSGLLFVIASVATAALTIGLFTRGATLLSLLAFSTLAHRNPYVLIAGDYVLGSMLLWLTVLPAGKRFSLDAVWCRRGCGDRHTNPQREQGLSPLVADGIRSVESPLLAHAAGWCWKSLSPSTRGALPTRINDEAALIADSRSRPSLAVLGVLVQLGLIYFATAWQKSGPTWWRDGTALDLMLGLHRFARPGAAIVSSLPESWLVTLTHGVLAFEFLVLPLILLPLARPWLRRGAVLGLLALHVGIACVIDTGGFSITMLACTPLLISSADWAWGVKLVARCTHSATPLVASDETSERGGVSPLVLELKPSFEEPGGLSHPAQDFPTLCCDRDKKTAWRMVSVVAIELVSAWLLVGMVASNYGLNFALGLREAPPTWLDLPQRFAAAHQRWDMFAPDAPKFDPQLLVRVRLRDGRLLGLQSDDDLPSVGIDLAPRFRPFAWRIYIGHAILQFNPARQTEADALRTELCRFVLRELVATGHSPRDNHAIELWSRSVSTSRRERNTPPPEPAFVSSLLAP